MESDLILASWEDWPPLSAGNQGLDIFLLELDGEGNLLSTGTTEVPTQGQYYGTSLYIQASGEI